MNHCIVYLKLILHFRLTTGISIKTFFKIIKTLKNYAESKKSMCYIVLLHKVLENADLTIVIERRSGFVWEWEAGWEEEGVR